MKYTIDMAIVGTTGDKSCLAHSAWKGKLLNSSSFLGMQGKGPMILDELFIQHYPITGTAEEIMKMARNNIAAVIAGAEFAGKSYNQKEFKKRISEIEKY